MVDEIIIDAFFEEEASSLAGCESFRNDSPVNFECLGLSSVSLVSIPQLSFLDQVIVSYSTTMKNGGAYTGRFMPLFRQVHHD